MNNPFETVKRSDKVSIRTRSIESVKVGGRGDTLRQMLRAYTDTDGRQWPAGTRYQPISAGVDQDGYVHTITVSGR